VGWGVGGITRAKSGNYTSYIYRSFDFTFYVDDIDAEVSEILLKHFRVDGGRGDDNVHRHLPILVVHGLLHDAEDEVGRERPLVRLVHHDVAVLAEHLVRSPDLKEAVVRSVDDLGIFLPGVQKAYDVKRTKSETSSRRGGPGHFFQPTLVRNS
jgi:hypothetical protein